MYDVYINLLVDIYFKTFHIQTINGMFNNYSKMLLNLSWRVIPNGESILMNTIRPKRLLPIEPWVRDQLTLARVARTFAQHITCTFACMKWSCMNFHAWWHTLLHVWHSYTADTHMKYTGMHDTPCPYRKHAILHIWDALAWSTLLHSWHTLTCVTL